MLFFLLSLFSSLHSELIDHLKIPSKKTEKHSMRNIDFIYLINLDQRPERYQLSMNQLVPYGIFPYRFSAVNGWELTLDAINDVGLKFSIEMEAGIMGTRYPIDGNFEPLHEVIQEYGANYFCHCMSRGAIGIALSHISILQDAENSDYETIWVMEDDIEVLRDPTILSDLIDELDQQVGKGNWDILFTDADMRDSRGYHQPFFGIAKRPDFIKQSLLNQYYVRKGINAKFSKIGARYGAHSMIIRKSGVKKLLNYFHAHQIFLPYDMEFVLPAGIQLYALEQDIVSNLPNSASDNGGPNYINH